MITTIKKQPKNRILGPEDFTKIAQTMQEVFEAQPEMIAQTTQFIQRKRKFTASQWIQAAVVTYAKYPNASLENLAEQLYDSFGISISEQAISQRFQQPKTRNFHQKMLEMVLQHFLQIPPKVGKIAEVFRGIYVGDCTTLALPDDLHDTLPGCGNQYHQANASLKIFCRYELFSGNYRDIIFDAGKSSDQKLYQNARPLESGSLELLDLGFFSTKRFENLSRSGIYWISRVPSKTVLTYNGQESSLVDFLKTFPKKQRDVCIQLGADKVPCRLVAIRAPKDVVSKRIERLNKDAKRQNIKVSEERLWMTAWTVYVTNIPAEMVSVKGIYDLYGLRWQVELLFKHWKGEVWLDKSQGRTGERILCEIYLKLLCELVTTLIMNLSGGPLNGISRKKIHKKVREHLLRIPRVFALNDLGYLAKMLQRTHKEIAFIRKQKRRKKKTNAFQTLRNIRPKPLN